MLLEKDADTVNEFAYTANVNLRFLSPISHTVDSYFLQQGTSWVMAKGMSFLLPSKQELFLINSHLSGMVGVKDLWRKSMKQNKTKKQIHSPFQKKAWIQKKGFKTFWHRFFIYTKQNDALRVFQYIQLLLNCIRWN